MDRSPLSRFLNQKLSELALEDPVFISPATPVGEAVRLMQEGSRSCVLSTEEGRLTGIFTEYDVRTRCMSDDLDWSRPIGDGLLTTEPRTIQADKTVADAIATFQRHQYRTLPVTDGDRIAGLLRVGDLLRHLAEAYPEDVLNLPPRPHQVMDKPEGG